MGLAVGVYIEDSAFYPSAGQPPADLTGLDNWRSVFGAVPTWILNYVPFDIPSISSTSQFDPNYADHGFPLFSPPAFRLPNCRGTATLIKWQPADYAAGNSPGSGWTPWKLSTIVSGTYDPWITGWAVQARNMGSPIMISFGHEMNGDWYSWGTKSGNFNSNVASDFVAAWQRVVTIFRTNGAKNVKWCWCPNENNGTSGMASMASLYPGDAYVDWIGWDGYCSPAISFTQFKDLFSTDYTALAALGAGTKPIMIAEHGCRAATNGGVPTGDSPTAKADWLNQMYEMGSYSGTGLSLFPRVQATVYFHDNGGTSGDWRLTSDAFTQAAWRAITADSRYQGVFLPDLSGVTTRSARHPSRSYVSRSYSSHTYTSPPALTPPPTYTFPVS